MHSIITFMTNVYTQDKNHTQITKPLQTLTFNYKSGEIFI
ncbi:hypothetical protein [Vibrio vulnificus YJ016]|uniref:Uncharacterized protein n=1 Tax=Vibrio vulnificus (strain YJ016) TaxID=196600 RepID=Q7MG05_VIBVY|nr:hypothetical protein [Vibrio vulnificus YJ016]